MGIALALAAYLSYAVFASSFAWRILLLIRASADRSGTSPRGLGRSFKTLIKAAPDILFLSRLFRVNRRLWLGEWLFHICFLLVMLRHLRYFLDPIPGWVASLQPVGICAGYVLPLVLLPILAYKVRDRKRRSIARFNLLLIGTLFASGVTGLLMKCLLRTDVVAVKIFMIGIFTFMPVVSLDAALFVVHFFLALIFLATLPTHIFAAPLSVIEARKREDCLGLLMHGE